MCRELKCLVSIVLVLFMAGNTIAELVGYWRFDEGAGTVAADSSGSGNNGTLNGVPQWVAGKLGGALDFDGSADYVEVPHAASLSITDAITIAAWTNMRANASGEMAIVSKGGWAANDLPYELTEEAGGVIFWQFYDNEGRDTCSPNSPSAGEWHHIAATYDGTIFKCYIDGVLGEEWAYTGKMPQNTASVTIGRRSRGGTFFNGMIDDVAIFNRALSADEIPNIMMGVGGFGPASAPTPPDGAIHPETWVSLSWRAGDFAVTHDVYFGESFDDVNTGTAGTFRGNQPTPTFLAGFFGYPYPDGLVPGTTYYWRVDEVNSADPNSPWRGPVWSFTVPPKEAYNPVPADRSKFIDTAAVTLSWAPGFGAKLHYVHFGDNFDTVNNATGGAARAVTTYTPAGPLVKGKTYYWRVDEFDSAVTHKGDVWSFTTAGTGGGVKGQYYQGMDFNTLVLTRTDPRIDFSWGAAAPDPAVGVDSFSVRWTGEVEAAFTETYTFYTNSDDGVRLWVDGKRLVNNWTDHGNTEDSGKINLVAGNSYSIRMEMYENGGDAVAQLRWSSPHTPKQIIPQAALSLPLRASNPSPANGVVGVRLASTLLTWSPGDLAASHEVYFGTGADAVKNATKTSPEYKGSKTRANASYDPGKLTWDTTYYWRVDEVNNTNANSPWKGNLWSFSTGNFLLVDNFDPYNDIDPPGPASNRIFDVWKDGFGTTTNGALVGNNLPPYAEQSIVHSGTQSMPYTYDNNLKTSEATMTLVYPRDWTEEGVTMLSLWFRGDAANAAERMYVALNGNAVVYNPNPNATKTTTWTEWVIDLKTFQGVNLTNVNTIAIGFGTKGSPAAGGSGKIYFDDIRLIRPTP